MSPVYITLISVGGVWVYLALAAITAKVAGWTDERAEDGKFLMGLLWPFILPWGATSKLLDFFSRKERLARAEIYRKKR